MKKLALIFILAALAGIAAFGQSDTSEFYVQSFKKLEWDLDARSNYPMLDQNNRRAALIKVVIPDTGFDFDVGAMGVVGVREEVGEIWVYVPAGVRKITIKHKSYGIIRDYEFNCPIESASVYELRLHVPARVRNTVIVKDSIIYVPTPVKEEKTVRKKETVGVNAMFIAGLPDPSAGFMVAWTRRRVGFYVKAVSNFNPSAYGYTCHEDGTTDSGYIWTTGGKRVSRLAVTGGGIFRVSDWLSVSAGAGYGRRILMWEDSKGDWAKVSEASPRGVSADLGLIFRAGRFTVCTGVNTVSFKRLYAELGAGFVF